MSLRSTPAAAADIKYPSEATLASLELSKRHYILHLDFYSAYRRGDHGGTANDTTRLLIFERQHRRLLVQRSQALASYELPHSPFADSLHDGGLETNYACQLRNELFQQPAPASPPTTDARTHGPVAGHAPRVPCCIQHPALPRSAHDTSPGPLHPTRTSASPRPIHQSRLRLSPYPLLAEEIRAVGARQQSQHPPPSTATVILGVRPAIAHSSCRAAPSFHCHSSRVNTDACPLRRMSSSTYTGETDARAGGLQNPLLSHPDVSGSNCQRHIRPRGAQDSAVSHVIKRVRPRAHYNRIATRASRPSFRCSVPRHPPALDPTVNLTPRPPCALPLRVYDLLLEYHALVLRLYRFAGAIPLWPTVESSSALTSRCIIITLTVLRTEPEATPSAQCPLCFVHTMAVRHATLNRSRHLAGDAAAFLSLSGMSKGFHSFLHLMSTRRAIRVISVTPSFISPPATDGKHDLPSSSPSVSHHSRTRQSVSPSSN
ncbi:hypothetical protein DFH09DRAFT_1374316, partial [Mycena vulgaris]